MAWNTIPTPTCSPPCHRSRHNYSLEYPLETVARIFTPCFMTYCWKDAGPRVTIRFYVCKKMKTLCCECAVDGKSNASPGRKRTAMQYWNAMLPPSRHRTTKCKIHQNNSKQFIILSKLMMPSCSLLRQRCRLRNRHPHPSERMCKRGLHSLHKRPADLLKIRDR